MELGRHSTDHEGQVYVADVVSGIFAGLVARDVGLWTGAMLYVAGMGLGIFSGVVVRGVGAWVGVGAAVVLGIFARVAVVRGVGTWVGGSHCR